MSVDSTTVEFFIDGAIRQASSVIKELMEPTLNDFEQAESDKFTVTIKITGMRKSQPGNYALVTTGKSSVGLKKDASAEPENLDFNGPNLFQIAEKHGATVSIEVKDAK